MATSPKTPTLTITLTQQSLNLVRQIIAGVGWAKSVDDIYIGGKLLSEGGLPELALTDWIKTDEDIRLMTPKQKAAYQKLDKDWADKQIEFTLTAKQVEVFKKAFEFFCTQGNLAPNKWFTQIILAFGLKVQED